MSFALQIVSLHAMGGPLQGCCAVSYGAMLYVYPTSALPGRAWQCKASWQAHKSNVTALHRSSFGAQLISGASDGTIHLCGSDSSCEACSFSCAAHCQACPLPFPSVTPADHLTMRRKHSAV